MERFNCIRMSKVIQSFHHSLPINVPTYSPDACLSVLKSIDNFSYYQVVCFLNIELSYCKPCQVLANWMVKSFQATR